MTIVLDPGHGGEETGAEGKGPVFEKEITLDVAKRLRALLVPQPGLTVLLTREGDEAVELDERTALANQKHADLFVSIHVNASPRHDARGAETYFLSYQSKDEEVRTLAALENNAAGVDRARLGEAPEGLELVLWDLAQAQYLAESGELAGAIQKELNEALGVKDRGVKQAPFRVLMGATMPAVLVEIGFISNPSEDASLRTGEYRDKIAQALFRALTGYTAEAKRRLSGAPARPQ
jgi:N-acetylmuramoyl-L-alanine amidase